MEGCRLSILIPTRNRQKYAENCVSTILGFNKENYEIIIQDNSDDNSLGNSPVIDGSERVRYFYTPGAVSFCDNFSKALEHACGEYCIYIGDDDCVLPYIFEIVEIASAQGIKAVRYSENVTYMWPKATKDSDNGRLVIRDTVPSIKRVSTGNAVSRMINEGYYDYQKYNFPFVYHGIVKRSVFEQIRERTGHYFGGLTPDIYAAVSLSFYIDEFLYVDFPFSLPGICPKSGAADGLTGRHNGDLSQAPHFRGHESYVWDERIPYVYSVQTIWAETAFKAMEENGYSPSLTKSNYYKYVVCLIEGNPEAKEKYIQFYTDRYPSSAGIRAAFKLSVSLRRARRFFFRGFRFAKGLFIGRYPYNGVENIERAVDLAVAHLEKKGSFNKIIQKIKG